jgi:hypothetical protein
VGPLVVAIDDEQRLDRASARVLGFAFCRLRDEPVSVVLARRVNGDTPLWVELAQGFGGAGLEPASIAPLDERTTGLLLSDQLGRPIPRPASRRIHTICGGNPFYALTIARGLPPDHATGGELPIPRSLADAMRQRREYVTNWPCRAGRRSWHGDGGPESGAAAREDAPGVNHGITA